MTLFRQLMLLILTLFLLSFAGTLYVTFHHSRSYYLEQLNITAQDTATSLGLSLSAHTKDKPLMLSMVNAIFDRGYFTKIEVKSMNGKPIISRTQNPSYHQLPRWFVHFVSFPSHKKSALLMSAWHQKGTLTVISDPSLAYVDLWKTCKGLFFWFLALTVLFLVFAYVSTKFLFKPLLLVADQARAICANVFQIQTKLPKTRELRILTDAMNRTVLKLKALFKEQADQIKKLYERSYMDPLTKIGNRRFFEQKLRHLLSSDDAFHSGYLLFLDIVGLKEFNQCHGFQAGDELVTETSDMLMAQSEKKSLYFSSRIAGATFAFIILGKDNAEITLFADTLLNQLQNVFITKDANVSVSIGISHYHYQQERSELLSAVDNSLAQARSKGLFKSHLLKPNNHLSPLSTEEWKKILNSALEQKCFAFKTQVVKNSKDETFHQEVFTSLIVQEKERLAAGEFIPMAEKIGIANQLDYYVIDSISKLAKEPSFPYSINLSSTLVHSETHCQHLIKTLKGLNKPSRFQFEIAERLVITALAPCKNLINQLNQLGYKVGLDKVGVNLSPLFYLSRLRLTFIKIDGSLSQDIHASTDKQFFVRHLKNAADTLDISLIATNIESEKDWQTLQNLGIEWGQGHFLSASKNLT